MNGTKESPKKIGVLGGTFNPIHFGHLLLAEQARQTFCLDLVLLIPSGLSYMKRTQEILPGEIRLEMARLAAADNPFFSVSDLEVKRSGNSYTCETLQQLHALYEGASLYYIVGADTLFQMEQWREPESIFSGCITAAAVRDGIADDRLKEKIDCLRRTYGADIRLLPSLHLEISSSDIRTRIREGRSVRYLMPENVRQFILSNGLYRGKEFS